MIKLARTEDFGSNFLKIVHGNLAVLRSIKGSRSQVVEN